MNEWDTRDLSAIVLLTYSGDQQERLRYRQLSAFRIWGAFFFFYFGLVPGMIKVLYRSQSGLAGQGWSDLAMDVSFTPHMPQRHGQIPFEFFTLTAWGRRNMCMNPYVEHIHIISEGRVTVVSPPIVPWPP